MVSSSLELPDKIHGPNEMVVAVSGISFAISTSIAEHQTYQLMKSSTAAAADEA
jgi:hypothetical protein